MATRLKKATEADLRRISITEMNRRLAEENTQPSRRPSRPVERGLPGLEVFSGVISGTFVDHNSDWQVPQRYDTVDRMRKGDATCAAMLAAIVLPILSTAVHIETKKNATDDDPPQVVKEAGDFLHDQMFDSTVCMIDWEEWLREALLHLAYGHYVFEKVWWEINEGRWDGMIGLRRLSPRHPRTIDRWRTNRHGRVTGIRQIGFRPSEDLQYDEVEISSEKLMLLTHQMEANNPLGVSIFRSAYKHWKYKDGMYAVQAIAIERQGAGTPFVQYPPGAKDSDKDSAEEMLQNIQAHEQAYMMWEEGWDAGFLDMGGSSVLDPQGAVDHHDALIPKGVLAQFLGLAQGDRGSFALSEDTTRFFNFALQSVADYLTGKWNREIVPTLMRWNFGTLPHLPHLRFDKIGHINLKDLIEGVSKLAEKGIILSQHELENRVRDILNLPSISREDWEAERERMKEERMMPGDRSASAGPGGDAT